MRKIDLIRLQLQNSTPSMAKKVSLKFLLLLSTVFLVVQPILAQNSPKKSKEEWVDSIFQTLDTEEKIGQLIMVRSRSNNAEDQENLIDKIRSYRIGGVLITRGSAVSHTQFVNKIQKTARVPMLVGLEAPNGAGYAIDSVPTFPSGPMLKAVKSDSLVNAVAQELANQMKLLGFQVNLAKTENQVVAGLMFSDISSFQLIEKPKSKANQVPAFQVGNDVIIDPKNISAIVRKLKKDLRKNEPLQERLNVAVKKILAAKYDLELTYPKTLSSDNLVRRLNSLDVRLLQRDVVQRSITLVTNQANALPIQSLNNKRFATLTIGKPTKNEFTHTLSKYAMFDHYSLDDTTTIDLDIINKYDYVILGVYKDVAPLKSFLKKITPRQKVVVTFVDPLQLNEFSDLNTAVAAYTDNPLFENFAAQMIFGAMPFEGRLPLSINQTLTEGTSLSTQPVQRFSYVMPEQSGMDSKTLDEISYIVRQAIDSGATPGCHVFVAHKGKVVYDRPFGSLTYDDKMPVTDETIYDLASITKVAATLQAVMFLQEHGTIDVYKKISTYLPELRSSNKKDLTVKDMLTHQSGLLPFIPMYPNTMVSKKLDPYYYSNTKSEQYSLQVAPELFVIPAIKDSAWHWVVNSKLSDRQPRTPYTYRYSDMASMIFKYMIDHLVTQPMNEFLDQNFYEPLGASTLGFNPLERFSPSRIAPTEIDTIYRKQLVHGTVHDERAAMLGGVAGHAGLFGDANDLAKIGQMLLNGGTYGGVRFFKPETVSLFTAKQYDNSRRGLGWDKPTVGDWNSPTAEFCSAKTFGHTGFTGTCIWVDPEFDLVFVFLSNRVWPDRSAKLLNANIRTRVQEVVYKSLFNYCQFQEQARN
jgi:CubicO group peptidase (beta-lactamase class C family)/beta-glucosidase-like glycosyl hydrolase